MTAARHAELGLSAPTLEPEEDLVHRLAALAAASRAARRPRRFLRWRVALATVGLVGTGVGGAWAAGSLSVPGLPDHSRPPAVRPSTPPVTPSPGTTPP
ncbi:MAG: hypothetical protein JWM84_699, partial [Nocardioides sp.]|nr:hypothetical protein [Nocardioides sp.]